MHRIYTVYTKQQARATSARAFLHCRTADTRKSTRTPGRSAHAKIIARNIRPEINHEIPARNIRPEIFEIFEQEISGQKFTILSHPFLNSTSRIGIFPHADLGKLFYFPPGTPDTDM